MNYEVIVGIPVAAVTFGIFIYEFKTCKPAFVMDMIVTGILTSSIGFGTGYWGGVITLALTDIVSLGIIKWGKRMNTQYEDPGLLPSSLIVANEARKQVFKGTAKTVKKLVNFDDEK